jgi:hypothetical protein
VVTKLLPQLKMQYDIDIVIAQAENVSHGKGLSKKHFYELEEAGVDGFSGGNHTYERSDTIDLVKNPKTPVIGPANVKGELFKNYKIIKSKQGSVAIITIQGYIAPFGYNPEKSENALLTIDEMLIDLKVKKPNAIVVNIHSEFSSEKVILGHYLDGKVSAVVGDHWHVQTADARILGKGTAHVSDVGMCGSYNSSIGVELDVAIKRWKGEKVRNRLDDERPWQLNAVLIETDNETSLAKSITRIQRYC